jgi:hypothetical protein
MVHDWNGSTFLRTSALRCVPASNRRRTSLKRLSHQSSLRVEQFTYKRSSTCSSAVLPELQNAKYNASAQTFCDLNGWWLPNKKISSTHVHRPSSVGAISPMETYPRFEPELGRFYFVSSFLQQSPRAGFRFPIENAPPVLASFSPVCERVLRKSWMT